jgi:hypothetical protein
LLLRSCVRPWWTQAPAVLGGQSLESPLHWPSTRLHQIVCASALQVSASLLQLYSNGRSARVCLACIAVMP